MWMGGKEPQRCRMGMLHDSKIPAKNKSHNIVLDFMGMVGRLLMAFCSGGNGGGEMVIDEAPQKKRPDNCA